MTGDIAIVTPVLDDWTALGRLLDEIAGIRLPAPARFQVLVIDDGSRLGPDEAAVRPAGSVRSVEIVRLAVNLGHQRAIAIGLSLLARRDDIEAVLVIDADGEDRPADIPALLAASGNGRCVLASRARRREPAGFRLGYALYKAAFRLLTGQRVDFGNFSLLPIEAVRRLVRMPELWNHLPAAIIRSHLPSVAVPIARGRRYAGHSRMNLAALILHGLSALAVYADLVFVRVLLGAACACGLTVAGMAAVTAIRLFTTLAIPGWTSTVFGDLTILLAVLVVSILAPTLIVLAARSQRPIVPLTDAPSFVLDRTVLTQAAPVPPVPAETA